jgi:glycosyltransferase involved in cell wall biosynthesis
MLTQRRLLDEEWQRWGGPRTSFTQSNIERSLEEYAEADAIVIPSDFARNSFLEHGVQKEKLHVCPYGVDLSMFHRVPKEDDVFRVVFVSSASRQKGFGYLLEALEPLVARGILEFWVVGAVHPDVRHLADKYARTFAFKGYIPKSALSWYYSQGSVFVHPSVQDGFGLVLGEAMACGLPVIATGNTGASNLYTDGVEGFIVPARDSAAIRERVLQLVDDPTLMGNMAEAALRRVQSLGGWRSYGESCLGVYRHVLRHASTSQ